MTILTNPKHELFAQALAKGENATKAYQSAGFKGSRANASRLKANSNITARVLEIQGLAAAGAKITLEGLLDELEHARQRADSLGQLSASVRAISEKARLAGLVVERQEIAVVNTEPEPESTTEVLASVFERVGEKAARALADAFNIEYDEVAVMALVNGGVNGNGVNTARAIERLPPKADRKRQVG